MDKCKICPNCGKHNSADLVECECGTDLTSVVATDDETEKAKLEAIKEEETVTQAPQEETKAEEPSSKPELIRICSECGTQNPANARKCEQCKADISMIQAIQLGEEKKSSFILSSMDGIIAHQIFEVEECLGRERVLQEYLKNKMYVAREQCRLFVKEGSLFVENKSHTNPTFVNNKEVTEPKKLEDGDILSLGAVIKNGTEMDEKGAYFMVRISSCS